MSPKRKSAELVQIQKSEIPPWHQSSESKTACPKFYVESEIKGRKQPGGMDSARGNQVHKTGAAYAAWCAHKGVAMDLDAFDRLSQGAGPAAAKILSGMRESYQCDFSHLLATEVPMSLDKNFQPTDVVGAIEGISGDSGLPPCYSGVLDALYMFREEQKARIDDLKSHFFPYDPDKTLQGKTYATFVFQHFPWVEEVEFRLIFVRYKNLVKSQSFTRKDIPQLIEAVKAARARQEMIHQMYDSGQDIEVYSGPQCNYCPLLSDKSCPISEFNENMQLSWDDRAKFALWYPIFSKKNNAAMKARVQETGKPITVTDFNGKPYQFKGWESESKVYPLFQATADGIATDKEGNPIMPIVSLLLDKDLIPLDDREWLNKLVISSTKIDGPLRTKKRVLAHQVITDKADKVPKVKFQAKEVDEIPDEMAEEENDSEGEWNDDSEF
jgi:hypothetical protein